MKAQYEIKTYSVPMCLLSNKKICSQTNLRQYSEEKPVNRDLYDIWYFLDQHWDLNTKLVEAQAGMTFSAIFRSAFII